MKKRKLAEIKNLNKNLYGTPKFFTGSHSKEYPKPLNKLRGYDFTTDLIDVGNNCVLLFAYRRRGLAIKCKFYAYFGLKTTDNKLFPLMIMHYHPDHKGIHSKLPCETDEQIDYTSRELPGAPELNLANGMEPDIRTDEGINQLICLFCNATGINIHGTDKQQESLF